ncbi:SURF1 family protein [Knoellia sp. 3-2P3]|uniref:SURF1 family protein n=1 Tax=unclassified Knoellia TaxID=2618719 RepID=UPI0023DB163A|nr:SURF1 family protein [Knoellia sp. 3-2P3]MDF2093826.1 SURF1 family protein [Knoellia sp. 3-2P3]
MLRTALKPRWLGLFAVLVAILVSFTWLGLWQLDVARDRGRAEAVEKAPAQPVVDLATVVGPHQQFPDDGSGRLVRATGSYAAGGQLLVAPRLLDGRTGYWVVAPFVVDSTGGTLAVVRGFTTDPAAVPEPPAGTLTLVGSLAPGESPAEAPAPPAGVAPAHPLAGSIDLAVLVNQWEGDLYNAFAFGTEERGADGAPLDAAPLERVPPPRIGEAGLSWRNAAYALQWWIFAAFAAYMWFRMVRDDAERDRREAEPVTAPEKEKSST